MPSLKAAAFPDIYLFDNFQNQVTFTLPFFAKLTNLIKFVKPVFESRDMDFPKRHVTATSLVNNMDISVLMVTGFIKIISKWGKKLFQSGAERVI